MPTGIKEGIGATAGFGTSSVTLNIVDIQKDAITKEDIPTFDQSTTGYRTYVASTLTEGGTVTLACNYNGYDHAALEGSLGVAQTITITLPKVVSTDATAPSYAFSGYVKSIDGPNINIDDLIKGNIVIKVADDITFTDGAA